MQGETVAKPGSEILIYQSADSRTRIDVRLEDETVWLTQAQMAELFQTTKQNVSLHIGNIYEEGELAQSQTVKKYLTVQQEGANTVRRSLDLYSLDVIISVGYRVRSHRGTQFRIWATQRLKEYIVKGFSLDDERLKAGGKRNDYFDELIERVRDIRTSERNFFRKITAIYTTSIDYDPTAKLTHEFFATVQNKFHWAIHGHTAAELIRERADGTKPNMGLTSWSGPQIRKQDVTVAKSYLQGEEIRALNLIVDQYLSFAEFQAQQRKSMYMRDWIRKLDEFLKLNEREILDHAGRVSAKASEDFAHKQYDLYCRLQLQSEADQVENLETAVRSLPPSERTSTKRAKTASKRH